MPGRAQPAATSVTTPSRTAKEETRERLIAAATEVFAEYGFRQSTIRMICNRAGVNVALVNYHFGDKLELYSEVIRQVLPHGPLELKAGAEHSSNVEETLRLTIHALVNRMLKHDDQAGIRSRIMMHELMEPTPINSVLVNELIRPIYDRLRHLVGAFLHLPSGHEKTRLCVQSIAGQVAYYVHSRPILVQLWPSFRMTSTQIKRISDHVADFSLAYLREEHRKHKQVAAT